MTTVRWIGPDEQIDWFRVISDLQPLGYSVAGIAVEIEIPRSTVRGWRDGSTPSFEDGMRLVSLWRDLTSKTLDELPRSPRFPSTASLR